MSAILESEPMPPPNLTPDPTIGLLSPRPSRARNLLLMLTGVLVLAAVVVSPNLLRPSVVPGIGGYGGSWMALGSRDQALTITGIETQGWTDVEVHSLVDVPGAALAGAWIIDEVSYAKFDNGLDDATFTTVAAYLEAAIPGFDSTGDALPHHLERKQTAYLVALWDILDCDELDTATSPPFFLAAPAKVELRTLVGTSRTETLPEIASPGFNVATLREAGACPDR